MADLAMVSGIFVSVYSEHYDYQRRDGSRAVGDSHTLNVLDPDSGEVAAIQVRDGNAVEMLATVYAIGDRITVEVEYRALPPRAGASVVKSFRRAQRPEPSNGKASTESVKV